MKKLGNVLVLSALFFLCVSAEAQTRKNQRPAATPLPTREKVDEPSKRNSRPNAKLTPAEIANYTPTHFFEYDRPGFAIPSFKIEHDDAGRGKISFTRVGLSETITDPLQLSAATMKLIAETLKLMSFLASTESYQYENDMPQMGNNTFTLRSGGKERTVKYNWTTHKDAKILIDEYRHIANESVWKFDLALARANQPLRTPKLLSDLDSLLRRKEISDPPHMLPLLEDLSTDERIPLIARNTATKLIKQIEKTKNR